MLVSHLVTFLLKLMAHLPFHWCSSSATVFSADILHLLSEYDPRLHGPKLSLNYNLLQSFWLHRNINWVGNKRSTVWGRGLKLKVSPEWLNWENLKVSPKVSTRFKEWLNCENLKVKWTVNWTVNLKGNFIIIEGCRYCWTILLFHDCMN